LGVEKFTSLSTKKNFEKTGPVKMSARSGKGDNKGSCCCVNANKRPKMPSKGETRGGKEGKKRRRGGQTDSVGGRYEQTAKKLSRTSFHSKGGKDISEGGYRLKKQLGTKNEGKHGKKGGAS